MSSRVTLSKALPPLHTHDMPTPPPPPTHSLSSTTPIRVHSALCACVLCSQLLDRHGCLWHSMDHLRHGLDSEHYSCISGTLDTGSMHVYLFFAKVWPKDCSKGKREPSTLVSQSNLGSPHSRSWQLISIYRKLLKIPAIWMSNGQQEARCKFALT